MDRQIRPPGPKRQRTMPSGAAVTVCDGFQAEPLFARLRRRGHGSHRLGCRLRALLFGRDADSHPAGCGVSGRLLESAAARLGHIGLHLAGRGWRRGRHGQGLGGVLTANRGVRFALLRDRRLLLAHGVHARRRQGSRRSRRRLGHLHHVGGEDLRALRSDERPRGEEHHGDRRCRADGDQPSQPRSRHPCEPPGLGNDGLNGSVSGCLVREVVRQDRERLLAAPAVDDVRLEGRLLGGRQTSFDEGREDACVRAVSRNAPRCRFQHGAQQPVDVGVTLLTGAHPYLPLLGTSVTAVLARRTRGPSAHARNTRGSARR